MAAPAGIIGAWVQLTSLIRPLSWCRLQQVYPAGGSWAAAAVATSAAMVASVLFIVLSLGEIFVRGSCPRRMQAAAAKVRDDRGDEGSHCDCAWASKGAH